MDDDDGIGCALTVVDDNALTFVSKVYKFLRFLSDFIWVVLVLRTFWNCSVAYISLEFNPVRM